MLSQYTYDYLSVTAAGRYLTPGTFLAYVLRGKAKTYIGRYKSALIRSVKSVGALPVKSVGGKVAYAIGGTGE